MDAILSIQPFKGLWTLFAVTFNAIRLPFWLLYFLPSSLRQSPKWTYAQAVRVRVLRAFLYNMSLVRVKTPLSLEPGREGDQFVVIQKAEEKYYTGITKRDPAIKPERIGGTWYPKLSKGGADAGIVVLHFHGSVSSTIFLLNTC